MRVMGRGPVVVGVLQHGTVLSGACGEGPLMYGNWVVDEQLNSHRGETSRARTTRAMGR